MTPTKNKNLLTEMVGLFVGFAAVACVIVGAEVGFRGKGFWGCNGVKS